MWSSINPFYMYVYKTNEVLLTQVGMSDSLRKTNDGCISSTVVTTKSSPYVSTCDVIRKLVLIVVVAVGLILLKAVLVWFLWNQSLPSIWPDQVPRLTLAQALGLSLLSTILIGR